MAEKVLHEFEWSGHEFCISEGENGPEPQIRIADCDQWVSWTGGKRPLVREILCLSDELAEVRGLIRELADAQEKRPDDPVGCIYLREEVWDKLTALRKEKEW